MSLTRGRDGIWQRLLLGIPYFWLLLFFLAPFVIILKISIADPVIAQPPFTPTFDAQGHLSVTIDNFLFLLTDKLYAVTYLKSVLLAFAATVLCLALGFPMAYGIARSGSQTRNLLLLLIVLPFWISFLLRVYAWMGLLNNYGVINNLLMWLGLIDHPIAIMYTDYAIFIGLTYSYLPFMILPLYATLERMDLDLIDAALDAGVLGCHLATGPARRDRRLPARLHPGDGRVRHPVPARRARVTAHRPRPVRRVLRQSRLAARLGGRDRAPVVAGRPDGLAAA